MKESYYLALQIHGILKSSIARNIQLLIPALLWSIYSFAQNTDNYVTYDGNWHEFYDTEGACSYKMLQQPHYEGLLVPNPEDEMGMPYFMHFYTSLNPVNNIRFILRYNDFPAGYVPSDDDLYALSIIRSFNQMNDAEPTELKTITLNDYTGISLSYDKKGTFLKIHYFLRGNRSYFLMAEMKDKYKDSTQLYMPYFESFTFEEFESPEFWLIEDTINGIEFIMPGLPEIEGDTLSDLYYSELDYSYLYSCQDTTSGINYFVTCEVLPMFYYVPDVDTFMQSAAITFLEFADSIISEEHFTLDGHPGTDLVYKSESTHNFLRARIIIRDNYIYQLYAWLPKEMLSAERNNKFFSSLRILPKSGTYDIRKNKTDQILSGLLSKDSLVKYNSLRALGYYYFTDEDLPSIYSSLRKLIESDDSGIALLLAEVLIYTNNKGTAEFISSNFLEFRDYPDIQLIFLEVLANQQNTETLLPWFTSPPQARASVQLDPVFEPFYLNKNNTVQYIEDLMPLQYRKYWDGQLFMLLTEMLDSGYIQPANLLPYSDSLKATYIQFCSFMNDMSADSKDFDETYDAFSSFIKVMEYLNTEEEVINTTIDLLSKDDPDLRKDILLFMAGKGKPIAKSDLKKVLNDVFTRYDFMAGLQKRNAIDVLPSSYKDQKQVAYYSMVDFMNLFEGFTKAKADQIVSMNFEGEPSILYTYRIYNEALNTWVMGISGPQPADPSKVSFDNKLTDIILEEYSKDRMRLLIEEILESNATEIAN